MATATRTTTQRAPRRAPTIRVRHKMYSLDAPGMPLPGKDFLDLALASGDTTEVVGKGKNKHVASCGPVLTQHYRQALFSDGRYQLPTTVKGTRKKSLAVVSGHVWGHPGAATGPLHECEVMVIGKMLGEDEKNAGRCWIGPSGQLLLETCEKLAIEGFDKWYVTNVVKTEHPDAGSGETTLRQPLIQEWLPILHQELRMVRPKYVLCLGADASKALLGKDATIKSMEGRVVEYEFSIHRSADEPEQKHKCLVMTVPHPAYILKQPENTDQFENGLARFGQLTKGLRWDTEEEGLDHRVIDSLEELQDLYYEINADCTTNLLAIDAEWHGEHPENEGAYLRTVQIAWKHKTAVCISLRHPGGKLRFKGGIKKAVKLINEICKGKRIAGQFLVADLEWLRNVGIHIDRYFRVAKTWEQTMIDAVKHNKGGFDTGMAAHAINETGDFDLTSLALRYTTAPRYDIKLAEWKHQFCLARGMKPKDLEGYGECPDEVLESYACYDADVTWRMVPVLQKLLCKDHFGNNCWEPFWMSMRALPAVLEINTTGVVIDRDRMDRLTETYISARSRLETKIRDWAKWPDFNINSHFQVREFLYGEKYNGKQREPGTPYIRLRPDKAKSLKLTPILSSDKRPMRWSEVQERGLEDQKTPGTNKTVLSILAQESQEVPRVRRGEPVIYDLSEYVTWIRDYRFISQVLKSTLRPPVKDKESLEYVRDEDGYLTYPGGLPSVICTDGRVRTHIYPTKETGRWSSARPPLQNFAKRREADYKRILGPAYLHPLRSMICAPADRVLIEADYVGAELFGMAIMSGDKRMIEHARRNILPEHDPDYYDIHSNIAVLAFGYDCEPTKGGLGSIGKSHMRIVAKSVVFGVAYGRMAKAIALAAKEEGVNITVEEAQRVIDAIFEMYPGLVPFFAECRSRALNERWLCGPFGRFRRFPIAREFSTQGDFERQAMNFPIQGMIADAVARAVDHLFEYRKQYDRSELDYNIALQVHDAVLLEAEYRFVPKIIDEVLPFCMVQSVPIYPCRLDGRPAKGGPYHLGIDTEVCTHWGERMMPDACKDRGIHPKYAGWLRKEDGWEHPQIKGKIWRRGGLVELPKAG